MAILSNTNTKQAPMTATGLTGVQTTVFVVGPRVYMKAPDTTPTPVVAPSFGLVPTGWTDLGVVKGAAKITYDKNLKDVRTGLEQVLVGQYIDKRTGSIECELSQFDDVLAGQLTGLTASVTTAGSIVSYGMGQDSILNKALLLVVDSVIDGKEVQLYNPSAVINFNYSSASDELTFKMTGTFIFFTWNSGYTAFVQTHYAAGQTGV
jgi:hypothetical protein